MTNNESEKGGLIKMRFFKTLFLALMLVFATNLVASAQIFAPSGNSSKASSQLIYYYDEVDFDNYISVTNTK